MRLLEIKCPSCGASVETTEERITLVGNIAIVGNQIIECSYCGSKLMTPGTEVQLADRAGKGGVTIGSITGGIHNSIISGGNIIISDISSQDVTVESKQELNKKGSDSSGTQNDN